MIVLGIAALFGALVVLHYRFDAPHRAPAVPPRPFDGSLPFATWATSGMRAVGDFRFAGDALCPKEWSDVADRLLPVSRAEWMQRLNTMTADDFVRGEESPCGFAEPVGKVFRDAATILVRGCDKQKISITLSLIGRTDATERVFEVTGGERAAFPEAAKLEHGVAYKLRAECRDHTPFDTEFRTATLAEEDEERRIAALMSRHVPNINDRRFALVVSALERGFANHAARMLEGRPESSDAEIGVDEVRAFCFDRAGRLRERDKILDRLRPKR